LSAYRCKCGLTVADQNVAPWPCVTCPRCKSSLALGPYEFFEPEPHRWGVKMIQLADGYRAMEVCQWCMTEKPSDNHSF
jgi:hypothetical protein